MRPLKPPAVLTVLETGKTKTGKTNGLLISACVAIAVVLAFLASREWDKYKSQPGQGDNAKIAWGAMCKDGQCRPAALLYGRIPASTRPIVDILATRPDVATLCLDSIGGNAAAAADLSSWLVKHKYDTCIARIGTGLQEIEGECASACTHVFVRGRRRFMSPNALFQIHGGAIEWVRQLEDAPDADTPDTVPAPFTLRLLEPINARVALISQWANSIGMPYSPSYERLLQEAAKVPSYRLHTIAKEKLAQWGVLTEPAIHEITFQKAGQN